MTPKIDENSGGMFMFAGVALAILIALTIRCAINLVTGKASKRQQDGERARAKA